MMVSRTDACPYCGQLERLMAHYAGDQWPKAIKQRYAINNSPMPVNAVMEYKFA